MIRVLLFFFQIYVSSLSNGPLTIEQQGISSSFEVTTSKSFHSNAPTTTSTSTENRSKLSTHFILEMIIMFILLILLSIIIFQWRKKGILKELYERKYNSLLTAYQREKEQNKSLESKIIHRDNEVLKHINLKDNILSKLSQSEIRFEQVFSMNTDAMMILDSATFNIIDINQSAINTFNLSIPDKKPFYFGNMKSSRSNYILLKTAVIIRREPEIVDYIISHTLALNYLKWYSLTSQIIHFDNKSYYLVSIKNITKRKRAELSLIENENRLKNLTENINDMIWLMDESLKISYVSPSIEANLGFKAEEVIHKSISVILTNNSFIKTREAIHLGIKSPTINPITLEIEYVNKLGEVQIGECKVQLKKENHSWNIYAVSRDITEKKKTDIALKKNEQLYRLITNNVSDVIFTSDTSLNIRYINNAVHTLLGYSPEEILEMPKNRYMSQGSIDRINEKLAEFFDSIFELKNFNNKLIITDEIDFISKNGIEKWGKIQINLLLDEKNFIYGLIGTIHDITQQHQLALFEESTNNFFKKLFYDSPVMMVIVDKNGIIQNINNAFLSTTKYSSDELLSKSISNIILNYSPEENSNTNNKKSTITQLKTIDSIILDIICDYERININDEPENFLIVIKDITHQLKAEKQASVQQEQFKALSEQSPDIIARFDKNLFCTYVNPTIESELNLLPSTLINNKLNNVGFMDQEYTFLNNHFIDVFINGVEKVIEFSLIVNHEKKHYQSRIIPEFTSGEKVHTIMVVTRNMTEYVNAIIMMHENVKQVTLINKAIIICNQSKTKKELYQSILRLLVHELSFHGGGIYENDLHIETAFLKSEFSINSDTIFNINRITSRNPIFNEVYIEGKQRILSSKEQIVNFLSDRLDLEAAIIVPIISNSIIIGSINLLSIKEVNITNSIKDTLRIISQELGSSINRINAISMFVESEESYRSLVNATTDLVWKVNEFLVFNFVNDKSMVLLEYSPDELLGTSILNTISLEEHVKIRKFLELNKTLLEKFSLVDVPLIKKSGQIVHVEINGYPLIDSNGKFIGYAGINRDISAKKVNEDLRQRKEVAERMAQIKQQFVSNISHELRTPLTAIIGHSEIINHKVHDQEISSHIHSIESNSKALLRLINDILDLSKIEAGKLKLQLEPTNIIKFFNDINFTFIPLAKAKNIDFSIHLDKTDVASLMIDELRLRQVVYNVVGNAIKFTNQGFVKIDVALLNYNPKQRTTDMIISVIDSGIGIDDILKNSIFDSFTQADGQSNKKYGGSGLGLSICKNLIELMDGSISFESKKDVGTTFKIIIPALEISDLRAKNELFNPLLINKKITIIENGHTITNHISEILKQNQCELNKISINSISSALQIHNNTDFIIINYIELLNESINSEVLEMVTILENKAIFICDVSIDLPNYKYILSSPIDHQKLYDTLLMIISNQFNEQNEVNFQQIEEEISGWSIEFKTQLINDLETKCLTLWNKANSKNSIELITHFEQKLFKIAKQYEIIYLKLYASEIKMSLKTFDIEKIKLLLELFPKMIVYIKSH